MNNAVHAINMTIPICVIGIKSDVLYNKNKNKESNLLF